MRKAVCKHLILIYSIIVIIVLIGCEKPLQKCTVEGVLIGRDAKTLSLMQSHKDPRSKKIEIPITDGVFAFELDASKIAYSIYLEDAPHHPIIFFPDQEKITLEVYPLHKQESNVVNGGDLNLQYQQYRNFEANLIAKHTKEIQEISDSLDVLDQESNEAKQLNSKMNAVTRKFFSSKFDYMEKNPSIATYYTLLYDLISYDDRLHDFSRIVELQSKFADTFNNHPYTQLTQVLINGTNSIKVGNDFIDFALPDLKGNEHTLSQLANGKFTLVAPWAPWCRYTVAHIRSIIPIYNEYQNEGFTVVGVAGQFDTVESLTSHLEKEKYPWLTLVEHPSNISDPSDISVWNLYGLGWSAGMLFLLDNTGKIALVNPSPEELRNMLNKALSP